MLRRDGADVVYRGRPWSLPLEDRVLPVTAGHALRRAQDEGFDRASIEVDADSLTGADGLYERAGFTVARTEVGYTLEA